MLTVVCTNANRIKLKTFIIKHFLVRRIVGFNAFKLIFFEKFASLAGYEVAACNNFNIGALEICLHVRIGNAAGADEADSDLSSGVCDRGLDIGIFERVKIRVSVSCNYFCHAFIFSFFFLIVSVKYI